MRKILETTIKRDGSKDITTISLGHFAVKNKKGKTYNFFFNKDVDALALTEKSTGRAMCFGITKEKCLKSFIAILFREGTDTVCDLIDKNKLEE